MKKINKYILLFTTVFLLVNCNDDDHSFGSLDAIKNLEVQFEIQGVDAENPDGDGSGIVNFSSKADNAISYKYIFSDGSEVNAPTGKLIKRFSTPGVNTYQVTVLASGKGGITSTTSLDVTVLSNFNDEEAVQFLTGGTSKKWYFAANEVGHLGVGPNNDNSGENYFPLWYAANPFEKAGSPESSCLYDNELIFSLENDQLKYKLDNNGNTFFNADFHPAGGSDLCLPYDTGGLKNVLLSPSESILMTTNEDKTRGTEMTFSDGGFMGYFINQTKYEILSITENRMTIRAVMGGNDALAWYFIFTTSKPVQGGDDVDFTNLIWSDEFDTDGVPNSSNWTHELGAGGWGNNESQNYTNSNTNSSVSNGILKITARKETSGGAQYSSARLVTKNKFDFKYGKIEVRAKLPSGGGTWPAIWMLGSNFDQVDWPDCGEIDIMEHVGNDQNKIHGTLHLPGNSGGNAITGTTIVPGVSEDFHIYSVIWTQTSIKFYVDGNLFHSFANNPSTPFNSNFFIILNVAMGGNMGGNIDPAFTSSSMEVDYVKVYQ